MAHIDQELLCHWTVWMPPNVETWADAAVWLKQHVGKYGEEWGETYVNREHRWHFAHEADLVMFKLTWY